jgi:AP-3 complex subunit delta-1
MFEKSLYDLIRGLRSHKGHEREYIQDALRECRKEVKGQDMNLKATALLKLTYLEMFGYDMSWASFNVLEVMSSQNYVQKKIGYLGAIQSFRPDTEVLMLAENLLKKDLMSPTPVIISLPLTAIPHVINPSMANSLLSDLLPRLTHSHATIRKKTIVTLYRLALVYPETLRPAWPKIKERLQDEDEDPSVTSAIVNVVCELGWRRPQDFLPLAPRLFDLLVQGKNNWMAIKIIKLFATLIPLEPRLIKKLLPPLTSIIKETPAMSLLYECINGIIQGGIMEGSEGTTEGEEIAKLCTEKLRNMLVIEGDPNLKYVALLAFQKIVASHPHLVSLHQDVILECIDDGDISIRMRALDLVVGMVNSENLVAIVERLVLQLKNSPVASPTNDPANDRAVHEGIEPAADSDDEDMEESLRQGETRSDQPPPLPEDYRIRVLRNILEMCSRETYTNIIDFEWYIEVLLQLVRSCPTVDTTSSINAQTTDPSIQLERGIAYNIGHELQNVAVRVKALRPEATAAAQSLILIDQRDQLFPPFGNGGQGVLEAAAWIVGEYASLLSNPEGVMNSLLDSSNIQLPYNILSIYLHAILKVFSRMCGDQHLSWTPQRRSQLTLLIARIIYFLEPLTVHPDLEVQERAVEYLELLKLCSEAASSQTVSQDGEYCEPPLLLTQALPSLFSGMELNPVAPGAQRKVPPPTDIDLNVPINPHLESILLSAEHDSSYNLEPDPFEAFYSHRSENLYVAESASERLDAAAKAAEPSSYQQTGTAAETDALDPETLARRKAERRERYRDDPFYIADDNASSAPSKLHNIIKSSYGEDLDIDAIPIMDLDLNVGSGSASGPGSRPRTPQGGALRQQQRRPKKRFEIMSDENIGGNGGNEPSYASDSGMRISNPNKPKKSLLEVDSSGLGSLSLEEGIRVGNSRLDIEQREEEERALREVERLRLEMQRARERVVAKEGEVGVVKRKKKKTRRMVDEEVTAPVPVDDTAVHKEGEGVMKKRKKKKIVARGDNVEEPTIKPTKKKKRREANIENPTEVEG